MPRASGAEPLRGSAERGERYFPSRPGASLQPFEDHPGDLLPPVKVLHLHAKRANVKRDVVGETDQVLLRRDRGKACGLPGDSIEVLPDVNVMVRKREKPLDPEPGRLQ